MDDNSTDDETRENFSPVSGGKKLKLDENGSQESVKDAAPAAKEENVDSGISADKSESTSSDDPAVPMSTEPNNEVINAAPSCSNVHAMLFNIARPIIRNYRKRGCVPYDDSDSSKDSDDLSGLDSDGNIRDVDMSTPADNSDEDNRVRILNMSDSGSDKDSSSSDSSDDSNNTFESDVMQPQDSDSNPWSRSVDGDEADDEDEDKSKLPAVLQKQRPKHTYSIVREIMNRELGLTFPRGKVAKDDVLFEQRFYGSLHTVYRLEKMHQLNKHRGCVNSINFHPEGHILASGSDDLNVVVWDWARNKALQTIKTGHKSNIFQSKFLHLNSRSQINIVTCARDGQVRLVQCGTAGGPGARRRLAGHASAAHKLHVGPAEPHVVLSAGEDGIVMQCDVRADHATRLFQVKEKSKTVPLYSVHGHPLEPRELVVAGRDRFVRVYDRRKAARPLAMYCPGNFHDDVNTSKKLLKISMTHLTCAVYNHDGSEILGSYNDDDVYLFDTKADVYDKDTPKEGYSHRYSGHSNSATFKGVAFFGPRSQFVVSGSDCAHIYVWDKHTEAIVQWMHGDNCGVVNCIETHPRFPVLATSGLDKDVKIWIPKSDKDPDYAGLVSVVRQNNSPRLTSPLFSDFLPRFYSAHSAEGTRGFLEGEGLGGDYDLEGNVCTAF